MSKAHESHPGLGMGGTNGTSETSETAPTRPTAPTSPTRPAALGAITSQLTRIADALEALAREAREKIENTPHTPLKDKRGDGSEHNPARTREGNLTCEGLLVPTLDEVKRYAATLGITDETATDFWYLFDGQGWKTKNGSLIHNWRSMLMSFNRGRKRLETNDAKRTAHIDAKMDEREAKRERHTGGGRRKADNNVEMSDEVREEVRRDFTF